MRHKLSLYVIKCNSSASTVICKLDKNTERMINWVALSTLCPWAKMLYEVSYFHLDGLFGRAWPCWDKMTELSRTLIIDLNMARSLSASEEGTVCVLVCIVLLWHALPNAGEKLGPFSDRMAVVLSEAQSFFHWGNSLWHIRART